MPVNAKIDCKCVSFSFIWTVPHRKVKIGKVRWTEKRSGFAVNFGVGRRRVPIYLPDVSLLNGVPLRVQAHAGSDGARFSPRATHLPRQSTVIHFQFGHYDRRFSEFSTLL
jgi:hypothetical protein